MQLRDSRLAQFFKQADPSAVLRALNSDSSAVYEQIAATDSNQADIPSFNNRENISNWAGRGTYISAGGKEYDGNQIVRNLDRIDADTPLLKQAIQGNLDLPTSVNTNDLLGKIAGTKSTGAVSTPVL